MLLSIDDNVLIDLNKFIFAINHNYTLYNEWHLLNVLIISHNIQITMITPKFNGFYVSNK